MNQSSNRSFGDSQNQTERFRGLQLRIPSRGKGFTQVITLASIVDLYFLEELTKTAGIEVRDLMLTGILYLKFMYHPCNTEHKKSDD